MALSIIGTVDFLYKYTIFLKTIINPAFIPPLKWWVFPQEIHKARLWVDEDGELHGLSFANQQIPMDLLDALNKAMHEVVDRFNGKTSWKENYVKFTDNGKRYEQFDGKKKKNWI